MRSAGASAWGIDAGGAAGGEALGAADGEFTADVGADFVDGAVVRLAGLAEVDTGAIGACGHGVLAEVAGHALFGELGATGFAEAK